MKNVTAIIATRCKTLKEFEDRPIFKSLQHHFDAANLFSKKFNFVIVKDNKDGLSKVYNSYLNNPSYKKDILLFVHDDVELIDIRLTQKLNDSPYVVTGLAGCNKIDLSKPAAWHLMSARENQLGEVMHCKDGNVWTSSFGPTKGRALLIDGLFIAVNVERALAHGISFDEDFDFHHYDLAFCMDCNNKKATVGVEQISVIHHGLGDSMLSKEWENNARKFSTKFGNNKN